MSGGRLEPMERLDRDYYLGERDGWFSDGENRDSESSEGDEIQQELYQLAGIHREVEVDNGDGSRRGAKRRAAADHQANVDFEAEMNAQLNNMLEQRTATWSTAIGAQKQITAGDEEPNEPKKTEEQSVNSMDLDEDKTHKPGSSSSPMSKKKSVKFQEAEDSPCSSSSKKAEKKTEEEEEVDFYDKDEDEANEQWVRDRNQKSRGNRVPTVGKPGKDSDAVLSCPACMTLLTRDCQQHAIYKDQYRAMFVENCKICAEETLFMPTTGAKRQLKKNKQKVPKTNTVVDQSDLANCPTKDLFHPVQCSICSTQVGVYDADEIYHFFNVLTGYA